MTVYLLCYAAAMILSKAGFYFLSGVVLIAAAVWTYICDFKRSGELLHLRGLFALFFVGGEGLACFKWSYLGIRWELMTWISFAAAFIGFSLAYEFLGSYLGGTSSSYGSSYGGSVISRSSAGKLYGFSGRISHGRGGLGRRGTMQETYLILAFMTVVSVLSLAAFLFEVKKLGFVPIMLKGVPHAYSEFHVSGVHYFTVSCALLPSLYVIFLKFKTRIGLPFEIAAGLMGMLGFLIPILCVSRYQLVFALALAVITAVAVFGEGKIWLIPVGIAALIPLYVILTIARSHDAAYLMSIFEMRWEKMPLAIAQPYMYVANNYENFNILVRDLPKHTWGLMGLAPLFRLTGLRFLFPNLLVMEYYFNKPELTTLTMFYDSYCDFGVVGVLLFGAILGACAYFLMELKNTTENAVFYLLYSQFALYMILSFFTTWFSNAATWFYLIATAGMYILWELSHR